MGHPVEYIARDSNPAWVADQAGDIVLDDGGQDPVEDEHNVLAYKATRLSRQGKMSKNWYILERHGMDR